MWVMVLAGFALSLVIATSDAFADTTWVVDSLLYNNKGPTKTVVWAGTKAHNIGGTTWDKNNSPTPISNNSGVFIQTTTPNAESQLSHANLWDRASAYASAVCTGPPTSKCSTGTLTSTSTVIVKKDTAAAASWARAGLTLTLPNGTLKGITSTTFPGKMTLYSSDDPVQSVWAIAMTDLTENEGNEDLRKLLKFTKLEDGAFKTSFGPDFVWKKPANTYFQVVVEMNHKGKLKVTSSGSAKFKPLTVEDYIVEPCRCKGDKHQQADNPNGQIIKGCHEVHLKQDTLREIEISFMKDNQSYPLSIEDVVGEEATE